ncbi:hypothetical protein EGP64_01875 [bacterium]|nr:hypothetical protein [bacterium]
MKIEHIKKLKSGKYKIDLENGTSISLYDEVILKYNLLYHKEIDLSLLNELDQDNLFYTLYNKALKYVLYKVRSENEIKEYMNKLDISLENQNRIMDKLKQNNLLNDNTFIQSFVSDKVHLSNEGPNKIKNELLKHKVDQHRVEEELQKYEDSVFEEKLRKMIEKKVSSNHSKSLYMMKQNLLNYFVNLGYDYDMILLNLNSIQLDNQKVIQKEYQKLFQRLSKKYQNEELNYQIKNRLYAKGFSTDEIQNVIKNGD